MDGIVFSFPGSPHPPVPMTVLPVTIPAGGTMSWSNGHGTTADGDAFYNAVYLDPPVPAKCTVDLVCAGFDTPAQITVELAPFDSPNGSGGFLFPFSVADLRAGEYMEASADHWSNGGAPGTQIFAHDVGCTGSDNWDQVLPGKDKSKNASWRIWGKPVRAVADGVVLQIQDGMDANTMLGALPTPTPDPVGGNNIWVQHGDFAVQYCHFQKNSSSRPRP